MAVMKWDKKYGMRIEAQYPESLEVEDVTTKQIYTNHEFEDEPGFLAISIGDLNLASYYTGPDSEYYVCILLSIDEHPEKYEDILSDTVRQIMSNVKGRRYKAQLPVFFKNITNYPRMSTEQKLALMLLDPIKKMVIDRLIEDGNVSKTELAAWIKDRFAFEYLDIDSIVNSMLRNRVLREVTLEEMTSSIIFLISDIFACRVPPKKALDAAKKSKIEPSTLSNYLDHVRLFFEKYSPSPEDLDEILAILTDMNCFQVIDMLRKGPVTSNTMQYEKLNKDVENLSDVLKYLYENQIISVQQSKKNEETLFLLSNIAVRMVFPEYLIDQIRQSYYDGSKTDSVLLEHLRILQDIYPDYRKMQKKQAA